MCGIAGLFDLRGRRPPDAPLLEAMGAALAHRGPDGAGHHVAPGVGLAHRRLAIIDLGGGAQPMASAEGDLVLVFNGEIYNFRELRRELEPLGCRFRTASDSEVILHAWRAWGEGCVTRLRGMFAFALWDRAGGSLLLARDPLGIKPLYLAETADGWLGFASELKGLAPLPGWDRSLDPRGLEEYLTFGYVPDPRTIYRGVATLGPGESLLAAPGRPLRRRVYWRPDFTPDPAPLPPEAAAEALWQRLRESVSAHLVADVPLGAFLSGGVDSGAVVAAMAEAGGHSPTACTVSFAQREWDETPLAALTAQRYGVRQVVEQARVTPDDDPVGRTLALFDQPFADSSALPTDLVCRLARRQVKVALSGDGGDESLAGYRRYWLALNEERARGLLPAPLRRGLFGPLGAVWPKLDGAPRWLRAKRTFQSLALDGVAGYAQGVALLPAGERAALYSPALLGELQGYRGETLFQELAAEGPEEPLSRMQYLDLRTFLAGRVLVKVDRASMAHGLEVRVPLLDHGLVGWLATLPPDYKLRGGEGKWLLRRALAERLPAAVLAGGKRGFAPPIAHWLRWPLRDALLAALDAPALGESGLFRMERLHRLAHQHLSGQRDHGAFLWAVMVLAGFLARAPGGPSLR